MSETVSRIGDWTVAEILGHGTFASVYRVTADGQDLALKWCTTDNEAARIRMELEMAALRGLAHPNIPEFIEQGEADGRPYFVMSMAHGSPCCSGSRRTRRSARWRATSARSTS